MLQSILTGLIAKLSDNDNEAVRQSAAQALTKLFVTQNAGTQQSVLTGLIARLSNEQDVRQSAAHVLLTQLPHLLNHQEQQAAITYLIDREAERVAQEEAKIRAEELACLQAQFQSAERTITGLYGGFGSDMTALTFAYLSDYPADTLRLIPEESQNFNVESFNINP